MDIKKIQSVSIKTPEKPGDDFVVSVNDQEFRHSTQTGAISLALDFLGEPTTKEHIVEFIELATRGLPAESEAPAKKKHKAKAEKRQKTPTFVGKLFTDRGGNDVYEVISETPPTEWQFTLRDLRNSDIAKDVTLNLKEFKELIELVPKRSRKKEGK